MKSWVAIAAWSTLAAGTVLCSTAIGLQHNAIFWKWRGFTPVTLGALGLYVTFVLAMVAIVPFTRTRLAVRTMWAVLLVLVVVGFDTLRPEVVTKGPKPRAPCPIAYRACQAAALAAPWVLVLLRRRRLLSDQGDA